MSKTLLDCMLESRYYIQWVHVSVLAVGKLESTYDSCSRLAGGFL